MNRRRISVVNEEDEREYGPPMPKPTNSLGTEWALEGHTRNRAVVGGGFYTSTSPLTAPTIVMKLQIANNPYLLRALSEAGRCPSRGLRRILVIVFCLLMNDYVHRWETAER